MSEQGKHVDDLTAVKGIGRIRQKWLQDSFDVYTFQALAMLSIDAVESKLKSEGKIPARNEIQSWIDQAAKLASAVVEPAQIVETPQAAAKLGEKKGAESWNPIASFVVEFQSRTTQDQQVERRTSVHFMEADTNMTWPGIEKTELCHWIEQQANIAEPLPPKQPEQEKETKSIQAIELKPTQVRLRQAPDYEMDFEMGDTKRPFLGHVQHENPISLEIDFEPVEPVEATEETQRREYSAHCHIHHLTAGSKTDFLDMLSEDSDEVKRPFYKAKLTNVSLKPGMYELGILVRGTNPLSSSYVKLPKLNVL